MNEKKSVKKKSFLEVKRWSNLVSHKPGRNRITEVKTDIFSKRSKPNYQPDTQTETSKTEGMR